MTNLNKSNKKGQIVQQYRPYFDNQVKKGSNFQQFNPNSSNQPSYSKSWNMNRSVPNRHQKSDNNLSNFSDSSLKFNKDIFPAGPPPLPPRRQPPKLRNKPFIQNNYFINYFPNSYIQNSDIYPFNQSSQPIEVQKQSQLYNSSSSSHSQNIPKNVPPRPQSSKRYASRKK